MTTLDDRLEETAQRFLRRADAPSTRLAYERELKRFLAWVPVKPGEDLLLDYRDHLRNRGLARTTVRWRVTVVRAFLAFAQRRGHLGTSVDLDIKLPRGQRGFAPRVLTQGQLNALLKTPDRRTWQGARDAAILACLGLGGLRASEVCGLRLTDIEIDRDQIGLRVRGKGGKVRSVSLPLPDAAPLRAWVRRQHRAGHAEACVFGREEFHAAKTLDAHAVRYIVGKHAVTAGLGNVSPHSLRHTEATRAIERGMPLHRVQARLGHSSLLTTARYLHLASDSGYGWTQRTAGRARRTASE